MNPSQMRQLFRETFETINQLSDTKGSEYRGEDKEMLANFIRVGERTGVDPMTALIVFMNKHYDAICGYARDQQTGKERAYSESIEGRIDDLILYALLLKGMVRDRTPDGWSGARHDEAEPEPNAKADSPAWPPPWAKPDVVCGSPGWSGGVLDQRIKVIHNPAQRVDAIQQAIVEWAAATFPQRSINTVRNKLVQHEIPELLAAFGLKQWDKADAEGIDVMILLLDYYAQRNVDVAAALLTKLNVCRQRRWTTDEDGVSQHVDPAQFKFDSRHPHD